MTKIFPPPHNDSTCRVEETTTAIISAAEELQRQFRQLAAVTRQCHSCINGEGCMIVATFQAQLKEALSTVLAEWQINE